MGNSDSDAVRPRTDFIDRLQVGLTALAIVHHAAIAYGGSGGRFYREVTDDGLPSNMALTPLPARPLPAAASARTAPGLALRAEPLLERS